MVCVNSVENQIETDKWILWKSLDFAILSKFNRINPMNNFHISPLSFIKGERPGERILYFFRKEWMREKTTKPFGDAEYQISADYRSHYAVMRDSSVATISVRGLQRGESRRLRLSPLWSSAWDHAKPDLKVWNTFCVLHDTMRKPDKGRGTPFENYCMIHAENEFIRRSLMLYPDSRERSPKVSALYCWHEL